MLNCPNCGAVIESDSSKCKYCGTSYFDFADLKLSRTEPIILRLKIPGSNKMYITKAYLSNIETAFSSDDYLECTCVGESGKRYIEGLPQAPAEFTLKFIALNEGEWK